MRKKSIDFFRTAFVHAFTFSVLYAFLLAVRIFLTSRFLYVHSVPDTPNGLNTVAFAELFAYALNMDRYG